MTESKEELSGEIQMNLGRAQNRAMRSDDFSDLVDKINSLIERGADTTLLKNLKKFYSELNI